MSARHAQELNTQLRTTPVAARRLQAAFTLVEILVVITIVGIVLSMAVLSLGVLGDNDGLDTEVTRYVSLMEVARDESVLQGREYGLEVLQQGYRFVELDPLTRQWTEIIGDDILRPRDLPETLELELYLDDQRIELSFEAATLGSDDEDENQLKQFTPHVFLFSSGDMTPFELHFRQVYTNDVVMLAADLLGNIKIIDPDQ